MITASRSELIKAMDEVTEQRDALRTVFQECTDLDSRGEDEEANIRLSEASSSVCDELTKILRRLGFSE